MNGYIKLDRRIMRWGWYKDTTTKAVWLHLLLLANWGETEYYGEKIERGSLVCTLQGLANDLDLSVKQIRRAIQKLEKTGEIAKKRQSHFTQITILKWAKYQCEGNQMGNERAITGQSDGQSQQYKNIRNKEYKNNYIDKLPVYDTSKNPVMNEDEEEELLTLMGRA